jgi:hypothetical protein
MRLARSCTGTLFPTHQVNTLSQKATDKARLFSLIPARCPRVISAVCTHGGLWVVSAPDWLKPYIHSGKRRNKPYWTWSLYATTKWRLRLWRICLRGHLKSLKSNISDHNSLQILFSNKLSTVILVRFFILVWFFHNSSIFPREQFTIHSHNGSALYIRFHSI